MKSEVLVKCLVAMVLVGVFAVVLASMMRPAGADAASDLVREVAELQSVIQDTNRALMGIQSELANIRRTMEGAGVFRVDATSSGGGLGIPVTIQNP